MEDPSKPSPSRIIGSSRVAAGIEKCCQVPGRSQNFTSTTWIFFSLISSSTCCTSLVVDGCGSAAGRTVVAMDLSDLGSGITGSLKDDAPAWARRTRGHQPAQRLLGPRTRRFDRRHAPVSLTTRIGIEADRAVHGVRVWRKFYVAEYRASHRGCQAICAYFAEKRQHSYKSNASWAAKSCWSCRMCK